MSSGVPQGTVLGPLMFLIYINDINYNIQSSVCLFADDCVLYRVIKSPEDCRHLQEDLNHLVHWTNLWQMNLNSDKCVVLHCTRLYDIRNDNNDLVTNDYDKAELFNSYFCSVFTDEDSHSLPPFGVSDTVTPIDTVDISLEVAYQKFSSVNISKSAGPDGWPPMVLKETADSISLPLYILFTKSINAGTFTSSLETGACHIYL